MLRFTDKPHAMHSITQSENECPPPIDSLLQAIFWTHLSLVHSLQGEHEEALKYTEQARLMCSNAAPSPVTFSIYFNHIHVLVRKYNCMENMGGLLKEKNSLLFRYHYTALLQINRIRRKSNDSRNSCFILSHWSVYHYQRLNCTYYHNIYGSMHKRSSSFNNGKASDME